MRNLLILLIFFGTLALLYFQFPQVQRFVYYSPCDQPIGYKIGEIDERFKINQSELKQNLEEAEKIWEQPSGKNLFQFDPQSSLTVNMVYDERQYLSNKLDQLGNKVDDLGSTVDDLESTLSSKQQALKVEISKFQQQVENFKQKFDQYEKDVEYWNTRGGAPEEEYQKLKQTQQELVDEQQRLTQIETKIREETRKYNVDVSELNKIIADYNQEIGVLKDTADTFNQTVQLHPEEGVFDPERQAIDIYYNISDAELIHTLAHEFGHALGMDHNQNKESIMYSYTTKALAPSMDDLESLRLACEKQTAVSIVLNRFAERFVGESEE